MVTRGTSRSRTIETAATLFQRQGYAATGVAQVIAASGTPKGSFYFNFPGGKEELGVEALSLAGGRLAAGIAHLASVAASPLAFVEAVSQALALGLETSNFAQGCPIATVALETATMSDALRDASASQFAAWESAIAQGLSGPRTPSAATRSQASQILMLIEGALLLARVRRTVEPLNLLVPAFQKLLAT